MEKIHENIKTRLYCLTEEYDQLKNLKRACTEELDENFWIADIGDKNLFVLKNNPIQFWGGPRSAVGLVGYFEEKKGRLVMNTDKTIELFKKAGQEAVDYFNKSRKKGI